MVLATGMLMLVLLIMGLCLAFMVCSCVWLYKDSKLHGQDPVFWVLVAVFASPVVALLMYLIFGRKTSVQPCESCRYPVPQTARYCENCGTANPQYGQPTKRGRINGIGKAAIALGAALILIVITLFVGLLVGVGRVGGNHSPNNGRAEAAITSTLDINSGWALISTGNHKDGVWSFYQNKTSNGYHIASQVKLEAPTDYELKADVSYTGGQVVLELEQKGQIVKTCTLSSEAETECISLEAFKPGTIKLRIINRGAEEVNGSLWVEAAQKE